MGCEDQAADSFTPGTSFPSLVSGVFSDGTRLVTASKDNTVRVWDATSGRELLKIDNLPRGLLAADFAPDGNSLVSVSKQRKIHFSRAMPAELFATVREEERLIPEEFRRMPMKFQTESSSTQSEWAQSVPGAVREWLVLSPIRVPEGLSIDQAMLVQQMDEARIWRTRNFPEREAPWVLVSRRLVWRPTSLNDYQLDFGKHLGDGTWWDSCLAYAVCYVYSAEQQTDVKMKIGYDDLIRVYLNQNLVFAPADQSAFKRDSHTVHDITLQEGRNTLLLMDLNTIGPWKISVRFTNSEDQPLADIDVAIDPTIHSPLWK